MKLTKEQKEMVLQSRNEYIQLLNDYARNPDTFSSCLQALDRILQALAGVFQVQLAYAEKIAADIGNGSKFNLVWLIRKAKMTHDYKNIMQEISALLFDKPVIKLVEQTLGKGLVRKLNSNYKEHISDSYTNGFFGTREITRLKLHKITFLDETFLEWNADKPAETEKARAMFDDKIRQLTMRPRVA